MLEKKGLKSSPSDQLSSQTRLHRAMVETLENRRLLSAGFLDPTFGNGGTVISSVFQFPLGTAVQADGKILVVGSGTNNSAEKFFLARFNVDGSPDTAFGNQGVDATDFGKDDSANRVAVQSDGKIVVVGNTFSALDPTETLVARYNTDGSLDTTFGNSGKLDLGPINTDRLVKIAPDGKILLAGVLQGPSSTDDQPTFLRLNSNGSIDSTFNGGAALHVPAKRLSYPLDMAIAADGTFVVAGTLYTQAGLVRITSGGTVDPTPFALAVDYSNSTFPSTPLLAGVTIDSNGRFVTVGEVGKQVFVARYLANGSLDNTFGTGGVALGFTNQYIGHRENQSVFIEPDGKIVIAGESSVNNTERFVERFTVNGEIDTSFGTNGLTLTTEPNTAGTLSAAMSPSGAVVQSGYQFPGANLFITRYTTDNTAPAPLTVPNGPFALIATPVSSVGIKLTWTGNTNGAPIDIYRVTTDTGLVLGFQPGLLPTERVIGNLSPSTSYTFKVEAINAAGASSAATVTASTPALPPVAPPTTVPNTPFELSATGISNTLVSLNWGQHAGNDLSNPHTDGFKVFNGSTLITTVPYAGNVYNEFEVPVTPGTTYSFSVVAMNAVGSSNVDGPVSYTAQLNTVLKAIPSKASLSNTGLATLSYTDPGGYDLIVTKPLINGVLTDTTISYVGSAFSGGVGFQNSFSLAYHPGLSFLIYGVTASGRTGPATAVAIPGTPEFVGPMAVPYAPYNLTAAAVSSSTINLNWTDNNNGPQADGYYVLYNGAVLATLPSTATSYQAAYFTPNTTATLSVVAFNALGESSVISAMATTLGTTPTVVPNAPYAASALQVSSNSVTLQFSDNSDNETGFVLQRSVNGGPFTTLANLPPHAGQGGTGYVPYFDSVVPGTTYQYQVAAVNGNASSNFTSPLTVMTPLSGTLPGRGFGIVPNGPYNLTVNLTSPTRAHITFVSNSNNFVTTGFVITRTIGGVQTMFTVPAGPATDPGAVLNYDDTTLGTGQTAVYEVIAVDGSLKSGIAGPVTIHT